MDTLIPSLVDALNSAYNEQEADRGLAAADQHAVHDAWDMLGFVSDSQAEELPGDGSGADDEQEPGGGRAC